MHPSPPGSGSEQDDFGVFHISEDDDTDTEGHHIVEDDNANKIKEQERDQAFKKLEGSPILRKPGPKTGRRRMGNAHIELKEEKVCFGA